MADRLAFVAYEGPQFRCGGIAAVMGRLPAAVVASGAALGVIAPFHTSKHPDNKIPGLAAEVLAQVSVPFGEDSVPVHVCRYRDGEVPWYFLRAGHGFFAGQRHPYDLPGDALLRDSLFFGQAVVQALEPIGADLGPEGAAGWRLVLQDWQCATTALAFASQDQHQGRLFLTLHNSYDAYAPPAGEAGQLGLSNFAIDPKKTKGGTILDRAFSVVEAPVFTVSSQFATEFTDDLLQREIMVPHLQKRFWEKGILGVDNGPFKSLVVPGAGLRQAQQGDWDALAQWKGQQRDLALEELAKPLPPSIELWGDAKSFRQDQAPWLVMAGRDDPRQKGYDVAAAAVEDYLQRHPKAEERAQFLFFPIPGDEGAAGLGFLRQLAERYPKDILVFLGRWDAGFGAALRGSAYGLMPSLYEPFGMANEFYLDGGCVGIGRATGGNIEQIVPLRSSGACGQAVTSRTERYHLLSAQPTGILYRERDSIPSAAEDWQGINRAAYEGATDRVEERRQYEVFGEMVAELRIAIEDGVQVYCDDKERYYRMLAAGVAHIQTSFSWRRASREYLRTVL